MIVLKIIGFLLLGILALTILILLYVIFNSVEYDLTGRWNGARYVRFRIHDLLRIVSVAAVYDAQDKLKIKVRLFGIKKMTLKGSKDKETEEEAADEPEIEDEEAFFEEALPEEDTSKDDAGTKSDDNEPKEDDVSSPETDSDDEPTEIAEITETSEGSKQDSTEEEPEKESKSGLKDYLTKENLEAVKYILKVSAALIKKLLPHIQKIDGTYSLGAPDTTGKVFGVASLLPVMYRKGNRLQPDFESEDLYFDGLLMLNGKIKVSWFLGVVIKILLNKNSRTLVFKIIGG